MQYRKKARRLTSFALSAALLMSTAVPSAFVASVSAADNYIGFYGDVNGDEVLDGRDLALLKQYLLTGTAFLDAYGMYAADINADETVNAADALLLNQFLIREITAFPNGGTFSVVPQETTARYYAIEAEYVQAVYENTNTGYLGEAYVNYDNVNGSYINWTVNVETAGNYRVTFRYANGATDARQCKITVNGVTDYTLMDYETTSAWTTWSETSVVLSLQAGENTIKATANTGTGGPNVDYIELEQTTDAAAVMKAEPEEGAQQVEALDRGVVAVNTGNGILVSWRSLGTDTENTTFKVFRNGDSTPICECDANAATCYLDSAGSTTDWYTVDVYENGTCVEFACLATMLGTKDSSGAYMDVALDVPAELTMPDGSTCTYAPNDCSVGDVNGDGVYEIFVKWDPSNSKDNSNSGYTGNVYIDCYQIDGTRLWRVDLGVNIRAGAHYTQFMVYDYDGDGDAEMICKTSDGTKDGKGTVIGTASADYRASSGYILSGNEYLTLFDGLTGAALDTVDYVPGRGTVSDWGDGYGNRVDRFVAAVAYLDGATPSCVMARGYYTRMTATAWDVVNDKLVQRWAFDSNNSASSAAYGDGNHNCFAADCDGDGKDEIVMGSAVIDDDGSLLYTTDLGHGDAMHIGDLVPARAGLEIFMCHEEGASGYGTSLRDAGTGEILVRKTAIGDTGRCLADNLIAGNSAAEFVGSHDAVIYDENGTQIALWSNITKWGMNSLVYWTGTLEREVMDRVMIDSAADGRVFTGTGVSYNNSSKSNACLTADFFGDWREELILSTGTSLRIYSTSYTTEYRVTTLMHNIQYRTAVAGQNVAYNQPPHLSYFLGTGFEIPDSGAVYAAGE